jgi:hypothetical protein
MVGRFYKNALLKGMPGRGYKHTVKHHGTGRRISVTNPKGPKVYECPHLAHLDPSEFDSLNQLLAESNALRYKRKSVNGADLLLHVPRRRTQFPGQHARCWYCGRRYGNAVCQAGHGPHRQVAWLDLSVAPDGRTRVETKGFVGSECRQASRFIEQALGTTIGEQLTAEFHQTNAQQVGQLHN